MPPKFAGFTTDGTNWIFAGSNGVPNWTCYVLASTNLSLPANAWTPIATNTFDAAGAFNFTNPASPGPQWFFLLQLQ